MAIAVVLDFNGSTLDQYDQVIKAMGLTPGGKGAPGGISHWVTPTADGFRVTDVWQSKEKFDQFAAEHIMPNAMAAGMTSPPVIQFFEVHNYFTEG